MKHVIYGHRGASGDKPENTLLAFEEAVYQKADGVELDIQYTKDRQIVVVHDENLGRTVQGEGWIKDYTLSELKAMNFNLTHPECGRAEIPTMEEVFDLLQDTPLSINIELKTSIFDYEGIEEDIVKMTHDKGFENRVIYSSFNHYSIMRLKEIDPTAKTAFLYMDTPIDFVAYASKYHIDAIHPALYNVRIPGVVKEAHEKGMDVNVWTVNSEMEMELCDAFGIDGVITNYPAKARAYFESRQR